MVPGDKIKKTKALSPTTIVFTVVGTLLVVGILSFLLQWFVERDAFKVDAAESKENYEIYKLAAEIREIRSDTSGSLFWLKLVAVFVTVGGAVGGYFLSQSSIAQKRLDFDHRRDVDAAYQAIIQELSAKEPVLRAAAAVKLGAILKAFPVEWNVDSNRKEELVQLTKKVLAAALSIEEDKKVLKTLTIALIMNKKKFPAGKEEEYVELGDVIDIDLSRANATDAYWADADFSRADFYKAELEGGSFRRSRLVYAQFRETNLKNAVFAKAYCENANFKMADLRGADFSSALLNKANFEDAKVYGMKIIGAVMDEESKKVMVNPFKSGDEGPKKSFAACCEEGIIQLIPSEN